jgi:hypothetical protein
MKAIVTGMIPTGAGLFAFNTLEEAAAAIEAAESDYPRHRKAARELAATEFASERALGDLPGRIGL